MERIAIIGAGAIGSSLGGLLRRAGHDVTLIGRSAHVKAIRTSGLHVDGVLGSFTVNVPADESLQSRPDLAFLTVKSQDVAAAVQANAAVLHDGSIVTCQNGVRSDELVRSAVPQARIASIVINFHANFLEPGKVTILYAGPLVVGRPFGENDAELEAIAGILREAFPTVVSDNIRGAHWLKLIVNLNNALPALTNRSFREVYADACLRNLAVRAMREGLEMVERAGITLQSLPDMPVLLAQMMRLLPMALAGRVAAAKIRRMESQWPLLGSTLQSLRRRRPTEIDYLNGEVVRLGEQVGRPTSVNRTIVELVHQVERTGRFLSADVIRDAIESAKRGVAGEGAVLRH